MQGLSLYKSQIILHSILHCTLSCTLTKCASFYSTHRKGDRVILNSSAGHSMRTKLSSENEGGVSLGVGAVDSPCLVPEDEFIKNLNQH